MTSEHMQKEIDRLNKIIEGYEDSQEWYSTSLEKLSKIRYNYSRLIERFMGMSIDGFRHGCISEKEYLMYLETQDNVNDFFSPAGRSSNEIKERNAIKRAEGIYYD